MVIASENLVGKSKLDLLKAYCCSSTVFWLSSFCPSASLLYYSCFQGSAEARLAPFAAAVAIVGPCLLLHKLIDKW